MGERALHEEDGKNSRCDGRGHRNSAAGNAPRQQKDVGERKRGQQQHGNTRDCRLPSAQRQPQSQVGCGQWWMSCIHGSFCDKRVGVDKIVSGRNVKTRFIPEEGQAQQWSVKNKNHDEDDGKKLERGETKLANWRGGRQYPVIESQIMIHRRAATKNSPRRHVGKASRELTRMKTN